MCNINITLYLSCMCPCRTALAVVTGCGCTFRAYNFSVVFTVMSGICGYIHKCVFNILYLFLLYLFREKFSAEVRMAITRVVWVGE